MSHVKPVLSVHWHYGKFTVRSVTTHYAGVTLESWNAVCLGRPAAKKAGPQPIEYGSTRAEARKALAARLKPFGVRLAQSGRRV